MSANCRRPVCGFRGIHVASLPLGAFALNSHGMVTAKVDEAYQGAVALFYLEDYSYREMAEILDVPEGTVKSRLARGIRQFRHLVG